jgi:hypothetical protein
MRRVLAQLRLGGFTSAGLHIGVLAFAQFGLHLFFTPPPVTATVIPVDVVRLDDVTRPPKAATPEPEPETTRDASPQAPPRPPQPAPEPPTPPEVKPVAKAEPAPPPPVVVPKPEPAPPVAKPEPPKPEPPAPEPPPQVAQVTPKAKPKPPEPKRDFDSILKDLSADKTPRKAPERARTPETVREKGEEAPQQSQIAEVASIAELDRLGNMIREQISRCWSPPPGARDADTLLVSLEIAVDPNGEVLRVNVVDGVRMAVDPFFRSAAESAKRAVRICAPLDLPADKYDIWKQIKFNFDPSKMLS